MQSIMFITDNTKKKDSTSMSYRLDINLVRPCHRALTMINLDHYTKKLDEA